MTPANTQTRPLIGWSFALLLAATAAEAAPSPAPDAQVAVEQAIKKLRGIQPSALRAQGADVLHERIGKATDVLWAHPSEAAVAITRVLQAERDDDVLILVLSAVQLHLGAVLPVKALMQCDYNAFPQAAFQITSAVARDRCAECLPVALKLLEVDVLDDWIEAHSLPVDIELGLIFSIGAYGDAALPDVLAALSSPDCVVRRNAVFAVSVLLPETLPVQLLATDEASHCDEARFLSWHARGVLDDPDLPDAIRARLARHPRPSERELLEIVSGLGTCFHADAPQLLREFVTRSKTPQSVSSAALRAAEDPAPTTEWLASQPGSAPADVRAAFRASLLEAQTTAFVSFMNSRKFEDIVRAATPEDIPLIQAARAAVLLRQSDEALHDWRRLAYLVRWLRAAQRVRAAEPPAASTPN